MDQSLLSDLFSLAAKYFDKASKLMSEDFTAQGFSQRTNRTESPKNGKIANKEPEVAKQSQSKEIKSHKEENKNKEPKTGSEDKTSKEPHKQKGKKHPKKSGYNIFFEEKLKALKQSPDTKCNEYSDITMPDASKRLSKEWKQLGEEEKELYREKAEEYNIILEEITLPKKHAREPVSSDLSDTESEEISNSKARI